MERFIELNLHVDAGKAEAENLPQQDNKKPEVSIRNINRIADRVAHKAASEFRRGNSGIFSK